MHFSLVIVQHVKNLVVVRNFLSVGFQFERKCCLDLFFCLKNVFAFQYRFAMANYLACFGNEETSPRSSRVIRRHPKNDF